MFQADPDVITWRLHLRSTPDSVYQLRSHDLARTWDQGDSEN